MIIKMVTEDVEGLEVDLDEHAMPSDDGYESFTLRFEGLSVKMDLIEAQRLNAKLDFAIEELMRRQ